MYISTIWNDQFSTNLKKAMLCRMVLTIIAGVIFRFCRTCTCRACAEVTRHTSENQINCYKPVSSYSLICLIENLRSVLLLLVRTFLVKSNFSAWIYQHIMLSTSNYPSLRMQQGTLATYHGGLPKLKISVWH